ncbi:MAG: SWIM zinc finger family protein, partial [Methanothrix sp.]|nr:SWIM zinc finger family protein [Methanothrix sp.]
IGIDVKEGSVKAKVQGTFSQPYKVTIELEPLTNEEWEKALKVMAEKAAFSAHLLSGQMPENIEEAFSVSGLSLFPRDGSDLETNCTCPDWSNPCKHIAAVYFLLAEEFDRDPFLIFKLRGKGKDELMEELRALRCQGAIQEEMQKTGAMPGCLPAAQAASSADSVRPLEECLDSYWQMGKDALELQINPRPPEVKNAILKRLGSSPFKIGKSNLTDLLGEAYRLAGRGALKREGLLDEDRSES